MFQERRSPLIWRLFSCARPEVAGRLFCVQPERLSDVVEFPQATSSALCVAYLASLIRSVARMVSRRIKRSAAVVEADYDQSSWLKVLEEKRWTRATDLREFLSASSDRLELRKVDSRIVQVSSRDYYSYRIGALGELIARHAGGDITHLVELGAGYGANLFSLYLDHPTWTFKGLEISANGIRAGNEIARHFALSDRISLDHIDLTKRTDPNYRQIENATVLTYFCIEQIPYAVRNVVDNIIAARPRRVIHVEPTTELLDLTKLRDIVSFAYIHSVDYQTKLFTILDDNEREGRIRIISRERMPFAPTINHDGFLCCWEPVAP
jgi:hypothetical protein